MYYFSRDPLMGKKLEFDGIIRGEDFDWPNGLGQRRVLIDKIFN